jgi:hypothetical protein
MPYVPKADRNRAQWMSLCETLAFIRTADNCNRKEARKQLGEAVADHEVEARWAEYLNISGDWDDIGPLTNLSFWRSALFIFIDGGKILDDVARHDNRARLQLVRDHKLRFRRVLFKRADVERTWGASIATEPQPLQTDENGDAGGESDRSWMRGLDKDRVSERIRQELREIYADPANNCPNEYEAEVLLRRRLVGVNRKRSKPIIKEEEFARMRTKRGQRKPKK